MQDVIILRREDLIRGNEFLSDDEVERHDFKLSFDSIKKSSFIVFITEDNRMRVLKERRKNTIQYNAKARIITINI
jgi:hypothetical protein